MQIAPPEIESAIASVVSEAQAMHGGSVRADERYSPPAVVGQRAMLRHAVEETADNFEHVGRKPRVDEARRNDIIGAMAEALGLREADGRIEGMEARADSYFAPGELIARDSNPLRMKDQRRAVQESINSRNIDPAMVMYESVGIAYEGTAMLYKPGETMLPKADYSTGAVMRQVHTIITTTFIDWLAAMYGAASSINMVAEKAEAADRVLRRALEGILVTGAVGTDLLGLFGAKRVAVAAYHSALDFSLDATTLGQIYSELLKAVQAIAIANNDRGGTPDTLLLAPILMRQISRRNNIDDGGSLTGSDLFLALEQARAGLGTAFANMGITRVQLAPSLNVVAGPAGTETDRAGAVFYEGGNGDGLRRVIALAPSPVRTAEELLGQRTLWALRTGGLECPDATSAGIATFKVR